MAKFARHTLGAALACFVLSDVTAAPALRILYHETIWPETQQVSGPTRSMAFEAYGRRFTFQLRPNEAVSRAGGGGGGSLDVGILAVLAAVGSFRQLKQRRRHPTFVSELVAHFPPDLVFLAGGVQGRAGVEVADDSRLVVRLLIQLAGPGHRD
jgi:hypothetical protein